MKLTNTFFIDKLKKNIKQCNITFQSDTKNKYQYVYCTFIVLKIILYIKKKY